MTKIKISKDGYLYIRRGSEMKSVGCLGNKDMLLKCGDWCAKFVEPQEWDVDKMFISACGSCHFYSKDEFVDERG